ncbi:MAG: fluoride ion transporter CrcB, partial [Azoarcus sp.]|nr:fluoride ion transporter CrcB [Azoarcus sp.]
MKTAASVAIGLGAACGAWLRWGLGEWLNPLGSAMPLGTLVAMR